jgi:hypothetical protein
MSNVITGTPTELPRRQREKRPSYGRFVSGCDDFRPPFPPESPACSTSSSEDPLQHAHRQLASLERAVDKSNHIHMLINQGIELRKFRAYVSWSPILNEIDRKLVTLQARLDAIEFGT